MPVAIALLVVLAVLCVLVPLIWRRDAPPAVSTITVPPGEGARFFIGARISVGGSSMRIVAKDGDVLTVERP